MTSAQRILTTWIETQFTNDVTITYPTEGTATVTDRTGATLKLGLNIYCDILELDTRKILAYSDLPHQPENAIFRFPRKWKDVPYETALKSNEVKPQVNEVSDTP